MPVQKLNQPHGVDCYITVGDDGKAVLSGCIPIMHKIAGLDRREPPRAEIEQIARVHDRAYVEQALAAG